MLFLFAFCVLVLILFLTLLKKFCLFLIWSFIYNLTYITFSNSILILLISNFFSLAFLLKFYWFLISSFNQSLCCTFFNLTLILLIFFSFQHNPPIKRFWLPSHLFLIFIFTLILLIIFLNFISFYVIDCFFLISLFRFVGD